MKGNNKTKYIFIINGLFLVDVGFPEVLLLSQKITLVGKAWTPVIQIYEGLIVLLSKCLPVYQVCWTKFMQTTSSNLWERENLCWKFKGIFTGDYVKNSIQLIAEPFEC